MASAMERINSILYSVNAVAEIENIVIPDEPRRIVALTLYDNEVIVIGRMIKEELLFWSDLYQKGKSHAVSIRP